MKKEKNGSTLVLIIILIVVIITSLIVILKLMASENKNGTSICSQYNYDVSDRTVPQAVDAGFISALVDTKGDVYIYSNHNTIYQNRVKESMDKFESQYQLYHPQGYVDKDGSKELNGLKLDISDVLTIYYVLNNGTSSHFVFIRKNGDVSYLNASSLIYDGILEINEIPELTNVVAVVANSYNQIPYAITFDGKEISLTNYLKK